MQNPTLLGFIKFFFVLSLFLGLGFESWRSKWRERSERERQRERDREGGGDRGTWLHAWRSI
jgi:hypothetical protein